MHICYDYVVRLLIADNGFTVSRLIWLLAESFRYLPIEVTDIINHLERLEIGAAALSYGLSVTDHLMRFNDVYSYILSALYDKLMIISESG